MLKSLKELVYYVVITSLFLILFYYLFIGEKDTFLWYALIALAGVTVWLLYLYSIGDFEAAESIVGNWMLACFLLYLASPYIFTFSVGRKLDLFNRLPLEIAADQVWVADLLLYGIGIILVVYLVRFIALLFSVGFNLDEKKVFRLISAAYILITVFCAALYQITEVRSLIVSSKLNVFDIIVHHYRFIRSATPEDFRKIVIGVLTGLSAIYFPILSKKVDQQEANDLKQEN